MHSDKLSDNIGKLLVITSIISIVLSIYVFYNFLLIWNFDVFVFVLLAILTESFIILTPDGNGAITLTFGIILSTVVIFGPSTGLVCAIISILLSVYKKDSQIKHVFNIEWYKTLGNLNTYIMSTALSSIAFIALNGGFGYDKASILYMFISAMVFLLIDICLVSHFITFSGDKDFKSVLIDNYKSIIPNYLGICTISIIMVNIYFNAGIGLVALLFFPYMLIRYSFKLVYDMKDRYVSTIKVLSSALEQKDEYTRGHSDRIEKYAMILANEIGISKVNAEQLRYAAILHDIGKIGIDDSILNKPGPLTEEEFDYIKQHPQKSVDILKDIDYFDKAKKFILYHHESYDGSGYPEGLKGDEIPLESKIIKLADMYDALTTNRPYRKAMTNEETIDIIKNESGKKLDPKIVSAFIELLERGRFEK